MQRILFTALLLSVWALPCFAQSQTETTENIAPPQFEQQDETPAPSYEPQKFAVLQTLDKITARTATVTIPVGKPQAVGPLFVDVKSCQKTPPSEPPEEAAFLQVWEAKPMPKTKQQKKEDAAGGLSQWVFSGWMYASTPALSAMNHPIYDVWLKDCVAKAS